MQFPNLQKMQFQPHQQQTATLPPITFEDAFETQFNSYFTLKQTLSPPVMPEKRQSQQV